MNAKDDAYDQIHRVLHTLQDTFGLSGKFFAHDKKDSFLDALIRACKAFIITESSPDMKDIFVALLKNKRRNYDCALEIARGVTQGTREAFADLIKEVWNKYVKHTTHQNPYATQGFYVLNTSADSFASAIIDVVFASDTPVAHALDVFIFDLIHRSTKDNDSLAATVIAAIDRQYPARHN